MKFPVILLPAMLPERGVDIVLPIDTPIMAYTATATVSIKQEILSALEMIDCHCKPFP